MIESTKTNTLYSFENRSSGSEFDLEIVSHIAVREPYSRLSLEKLFSLAEISEKNGKATIYENILFLFLENKKKELGCKNNDPLFLDLYGTLLPEQITPCQLELFIESASSLPQEIIFSEGEKMILSQDLKLTLFHTSLFFQRLARSGCKEVKGTLFFKEISLQEFDIFLKAVTTHTSLTEEESLIALALFDFFDVDLKNTPFFENLKSFVPTGEDSCLDFSKLTTFLEQAEKRPLFLPESILEALPNYFLSKHHQGNSYPPQKIFRWIKQLQPTSLSIPEKLPFFLIPSSILASQNLTSLDCTSHKLLENKDLKRIKRIKGLKTLKISGCLKLTDQGIKKLKNHAHLTTINLSFCHRITDKSLRHLSSCKKLSALHLELCTNVTDKGLFYLRKLRSLHTLNLQFCHKITIVGLIHLKDRESLRDLSFGGCKISIEALQFDPSPLSSTQFFFRTLEGGLIQLKFFQHIRKLSVPFSEGLSDEHLRHLSSLPNLAELDLSHCKKVTNAGLKEVGKVHHLTQFSCEGLTEISDRGLKCLVKKKTLTHLNVSNCPKISDKGIRYLERLPLLTRFSGAHLYRITNRALSSLAVHQHLQFLELRHCSRVTNRGLEKIIALKNLTYLDLSFCKKLSSRGISHLKALRKLNHLDIGYLEKIQDRGILALKRLRHLTFLNLHGLDGITIEGFCALRKALPWVYIGSRFENRRVD